MEDLNGYAVYFFPPALEALGEAIQPYLVDGPAGAHVLCREIDTAGALLGMKLDGLSKSKNQPVQIEMMVPTNMVRLIVSASSDETFGFGPRVASGSRAAAAATPADPAPQELPGGEAVPAAEPAGTPAPQ